MKHRIFLSLFLFAAWFLSLVKAASLPVAWPNYYVARADSSSYVTVDGQQMEREACKQYIKGLKKSEQQLLEGAEKLEYPFPAPRRLYMYLIFLSVSK